MVLIGTNKGSNPNSKTDIFNCLVVSFINTFVIKTNVSYKEALNCKVITIYTALNAKQRTNQDKYSQFTAYRVSEGVYDQI